MIRLLFLLLILSSLTSCKKNENTLKVAATLVPHLVMLEEVKEDLSKQGIELEIIAIEDYQTPNRALSDCEIDANFFQHAPFLNSQISQFGYQIESAGKIHLEPMGAYSLKYKTIDNIPKNAKIAIPSDPSNAARALLLLKANGVINFKESSMPNLMDYKEDCFEFIEVDAALLPRTLEDVDLALIPTNYALQANLNPEKDALIIEDGNSPYANIVAVRKGDSERPDIILLIEALKSDKTKEFVADLFGPSVKILD
jgi:D-methionine transport system substrate-binding protein